MNVLLANIKEIVMDATGVLVHGYNVHAKNWEEVVWGRPPHHLGRATQGLKVIWRENARLALFGGGGSNHGQEPESVYTIKFLIRRWSELRQFSAFRGLDHSELQKRLDHLQFIVDSEVSSTNTHEELCEAEKTFRKRRVNRAVLVTSPDHMSRCLQIAAEIWNSGSTKEKPWLSIGAEMSQTMYSPEGIKGVMVKERQEPHDPDEWLR